MGQPYIGEIRLFAGNFAPLGWELCAGQLVSIADYDALFNLIGTTYGGDGQSTFRLPDLRGRVPAHFGLGAASFPGVTFGVEEVTLGVAQVPLHSHALRVSTQPAVTSSPGNAHFAQAEEPLYTLGPPTTNMAQTTATGGSQPHDNRQPYVGLNFIISMFGIFPSPT
jgi:microcystin-dependent protein